MKKMVKDVGVLAACLLICVGLGACGKREAAPRGEETVTEERWEGGEDAGEVAVEGAKGQEGGGAEGQGVEGVEGQVAGGMEGQGAGSAEGQPVGNAGGRGPGGSETLDPNEARRIAEQTYQVDLTPLGQVTFAAYAPDTEHSPLADVEFALIKDGKIWAQLEGMYKDNIRMNEVFEGVEAVSFSDYNGDRYTDIIVICSYMPSSGPDSGRAYSETRIYRGNADGVFVLERDLSEEASMALVKQTVKSVLGFLKSSQTPPGVEISWRQAYIDFLYNRDPGQWAGFAFIWLDDDEIPELVEIGNSQTDSCAIVSYAGGALQELQLSQPSFTYIERGGLLCSSGENKNRSCDLVYSLADGTLKLVGEGYYGTEVNEPLKRDAAGKPVCQYRWNGAALTEKAYYNALSRVYDESQAVDGYQPDRCYTAEELAKQLKNGSLPGAE